MGKGTGKALPLTLTDRVASRLAALGGVPRQSATALAEWLAPTIQALVKAELKKAAAKTVERTMKAVTVSVNRPQVTLDEPQALGEAIGVDGHVLRMDLPVLPYTGRTDERVEILRVMHGLSSTASYLVAAVKGSEGIVAVRRYGRDDYNVKFYPSMRYWDVTPGEVHEMGGRDGSFLMRGPYERMHMTEQGAEVLLAYLQARQRPVKAILTRMLAIAFRPLSAALDALYAYTRATA